MMNPALYNPPYHPPAATPAPQPTPNWNPQGNFGGRGVASATTSYLPQHDGIIFDPREDIGTKQTKFLQNMAYYGGGPSLAQTQLQAGMGQAMSQAQALAASQRGINPALAARIAAQAQAGIQQDTNVQGAQLRSQEQLNSLNMLQQEAAGEQNYSMAQMGIQGQKDLQHSGLANVIFGGISNGAGAAMAHAAHGGLIPGKAAVSSDSPRNDTVPAMLSPGEVVLPRSIVAAKHPGDAAKAFLEHVKSQRKPGEAPSFAKVLQMHREMGEHLEKLCMGGKVK